MDDLRRALPNAYNQEGFLNEAVRRIFEHPDFARAKPEFVRAFVESELERGTDTMFGIMRAAHKVALFELRS